LISNGDGSFTESTLPGATTGPNYYTVTAGDFNGDGLADFATQNSDTVLANVYLNQATEQATAVLNKVSIEGSGNHTVQASYAGDTAFAASNATIQLTGATIATSLTITAPATAAYGAQVQATATLAPNAYGSLLTDGELVTFSYNGQSSGTAKLSKGVATYTFTNLAAGSDTLTASYPGDTNFNSSTSSAANITVSAAPTPAVILSPTSLTFAAQAIGTTSATQSVTLTNTGQGTLAITTIAASGPFGETNTCGTSVAPAATCTIAVTYSPTAAQNDTGSITITDNASGSSQSVALTGTGSSFNVTASATQLSIASPGGSATDTLQIAPNSGFSGTVSLSCAVKFTGTGTASDLPTCTLNPASLTLSSGSAGSTTLTVSSTATASSSAKAMVSTGSALAALLLVGFLPRRRWRNSLSIVVLALGFAFSVASLTGCGGSSKSSKTSDSGTTAGSYSVTVTASSTSFTGTATIPLTIQ